MKNIFYDKSKVDYGNLLFPRRALWMLLIPLIIEQMLNSLMGMVDTLMVSRVGAEAISAVSLVDSINNLVLQVFAAMAAGAAIICSQYLGRKDEKGCNDAAKQIVLTVVVISSVIMIIGVGFRKPLLHLIFGSVEEAVMTNAQMYFLITALSYPFIALFQAGAAFYRACGNSKFTMKTALIANVANIVGNTLFIFILQMGAAGAAISTLISRALCAFVVFYALRKPGYAIQLKNYFSIRPDLNLIVKILAIGVPSGIENGMFQFGKLAIQSTVSTLGTIAIAAQAMTNILENLNGIAGIGIGIGMMTVVGQCLGAGRKDEAIYYIKKLTAVAEIVIIASCALVFLATKPVTILGGMEPESAKMCLYMVGWITVVKPIVWTLAFIPAYGMRAAGDVRFSMILSCISMWAFRVTLCIYLCRVHGFGPIAVWIGMFTDWTIRGIVFTFRFMGRRWLAHKVV